MSASRRRFTPEFKVEAAHRVIDTGRAVAEVSRELGVHEVTLGKWVRDERRRVDAAKIAGGEPLSAVERAELAELRKRVADQEKDLEFLKKAAAYFAANPPKPNGSR